MSRDPRENSAHELDWPLNLAIGLQAMDLGTFLIAASVLGIHGEANPLAAAIYQATGPLGLSAFKIGGTLAVVLLMPAPFRWLSWVLAGAGALGVVTNLLSLWVS